MIEGSWDMLQLVCGNHGDDLETKMILKEGPKSMFYACPKHIHVYQEHAGGTACTNRLSQEDFLEALEFLQKESGMGTPFVADLTGMSWSRNGIEYEVLSQENNVFTVKMLNKKAIS